MLGIPPWANPKNILLAGLTLAVVVIGALWLIGRTTIVATKADLSSCNKDLVVTKANLDDCEKNKKAVVAQYNDTEKTNEETNQTRKKILDILTRPTKSVKESQTAVAEKPKEMTINEDDKGKLADLFSAANAVVISFNTRVRPHAGSQTK